MEARISNEFDAGFTWLVDEPMARASHALVADGRYWLVDPVDWEPALERAAALGEPAGVLQLLDRHGRDSARLAERLGVPLLKLPRTLPGTPLEPTRLIDHRWWREVVLWWPQQQLLVVPEAVGTAPAMALGRPLGVHPLLRLTPPYSLRCFKPRHILVGHGPSLHDDANDALEQSLEHARSDIPRGIAKLPGLLKRGG
ncbi:hypothetical protein [Conexibacter sp. CPCC 206217]|uniref:hypothetical protein n=1 Tax=Conexibacter sp. CPCC 206217 TaxID=3064574 RepID=UPI00271B3ABC|nr:hypothetical protein [Conexibacter sp. CPCC 206217]MDO8213201.1 hypothetical protein [Conexibacter sp. CPCC 206217]